MFVCMDSTAKYLGTVMPVTQAIWGRFFFHLVSLIIFFLIFKPKVNLKLTNDEIVQHLINSFLKNKSNINFKNIAIDNKK